MENIEANWAGSFKIRAKIEIQVKAIFSASHFADELTVHKESGGNKGGGTEIDLYSTANDPHCPPQKIS